VREGNTTKALRARELGISLRTLYYHPLKPDKDWSLKCQIEEVLREHPSYGSRHLAIHLKMNRKKVKRVMNLFGLSVYTTHAVQLVLSAFMNALHDNPRPTIFHSDNGSEYNAEIYIEALETVGTMISRSAPRCLWENGYQESFYNQFKIDFGDPSRFATLGELVLAVYQTIWQYNHTRIHSALKMSPMQFALQSAAAYNSGNKDRVQ